MISNMVAELQGPEGLGAMMLPKAMTAVFYALAAALIYTAWTNHLHAVHTFTSAFLRIIFPQETSSRNFLQSLKQNRRYWHSEVQEDVQLRIEKDIPLQEQLDRVPFNDHH